MMHILDIEEAIVELKISLLYTYQKKYQKEIDIRLKQMKDQQWLDEMKEKRIKTNYIEIKNGKEFLNIRISNSGKVIGRQHFKYGFEYFKEEENAKEEETY